MRRLSILLPLLALACSGNKLGSETDDAGIPIEPQADGGMSVVVDGAVSVVDGGGGGTPDARVVKRGDGGMHPGSDEGPPFVNDLPPYPDCPGGNDFKPEGGYNGHVKGQKKCGPASPDCPTTYIDGNTGSPCTTAADCTGKDPICLTGAKYPG